jgi:ABC-2 type transport system ATP-binding protein
VRNPAPSKKQCGIVGTPQNDIAMCSINLNNQNLIKEIMKNLNEIKDTVIEVKNVTKCFKDVRAVDGLNLQIYRGEYVALLGPNGAGKTTLVEMIEGIQKPDSGEILITGKYWKDSESQLREILGISLQETEFVDKLTTQETLNLFGSFYKLSKKRSDEILELIGLEEKRKSYVVNLSGGQRQKLALGIALINEPNILILDEPTTGLDPHARREIWNILQNLKQKGTTLILTTHYMEEAEYLCDRILIMYKGKFLAEGTLEELLDNYANGEIIEFTLDKRINSNQLSGIEGVLDLVWQSENGKGKLIVKDIVTTLPNFLKIVENEKINLKELECRKMTLDDLFISMTGRHLDE